MWCAWRVLSADAGFLERCIEAMAFTPRLRTLRIKFHKIDYRMMCCSRGGFKDEVQHAIDGKNTRATVRVGEQPEIFRQDEVRPCLKWKYHQRRGCLFTSL